MKKILAFFFILSISLCANEFVNEESSAFGQSNTQEQTLPPKLETPVISKNLYLSYLSSPKHIYKNQRFEIEVKALITRSNFNSIKTKFTENLNMDPLNANSSWKRSSENRNVYTNKFYFKAYEENFKMPKITVSLYNGNRLVESRSLASLEVSFSEIAKGDERFSNVIAKQLTLLGSKSKQYTNKEALTILDINGFESNLEDFNLQGIEDQGFTVIEDNYPNQHIIYYAIIPIHTKNIIFDYYNIDKKRLEKIRVPIVFTEELVSTQTDLNPNNSSFEFYKKIIVAALAIVFLLLFIWIRRFYLLIIFLILAIIFAISVIPNKMVKLKQNSVIYILPTKNSTIFRKVPKAVVVEDLKEKNGFIKIMFKIGDQNYIGWVKEEDVIKN